jgi:hypothetical protein
VRNSLVFGEQDENGAKDAFWLRSAESREFGTAIKPWGQLRLVMRMAIFILATSIMTSKSMDKDSIGSRMGWCVKVSSQMMSFCMEK